MLRVFPFSTGCSRWPEREDCDQECLKEIEADPENCLVWNMVSHWYEGKKCRSVTKAFGPLHYLDHAPALCGADHTTMEWKDIAPQKLPELFAKCQPI
jgi:hypothetical protein